MVSAPVVSDLAEAIRLAYAPPPPPRVMAAPHEMRHRRSMEALDRQLQANGYSVEEVDGRVTVKLPGPPPYCNEQLFGRDDNVWISALGMLKALTMVQAGAARSARAMALAQAGALTARELEHLRYLAAADNPFDDVRPETLPLTGEDARAVLAVVDQYPQTGDRCADGHEGGQL